MRNDQIALSVVVPTYNNEKYVSQCIDSILAQIDGNVRIEIIIVNDGSTDDTGRLLTRYLDNENVRIYNIENGGVSHARNFGIQKSAGDYITFVDSDDYLLPDTYKEIKDAIIKYNAPDFIRYNYRSEGTKRYNNCLYDLVNVSIREPSKKIPLLEHFLTRKKQMPNLCQLLVIKSSIAKTLSFNEELSYMEDVVFYQDLFRNSNEGVFIDKKGYVLRANDSSLSRSVNRLGINIKDLFSVNSILAKNVPMKLVKDMNKNHLMLVIAKLSEMYDDKSVFIEFMDDEKNRLNIKHIADNGKGLECFVMKRIMKSRRYLRNTERYIKIRNLIKMMKGML